MRIADTLIVEGAGFGFITALALVEAMMGYPFYAVIGCAAMARIYFAHIRPKLQRKD